MKKRQRKRKLEKAQVYHKTVTGEVRKLKEAIKAQERRFWEV